MKIKNNIPNSISEKIGKNLHLKTNHPIKIIKDKIYFYFNKISENDKNHFIEFDKLPSKVEIENNFDLLLIAKDHPSRSMSDTYYFDSNHVLRTHTSAHQNELLKKGFNKFLVTGDVYRKDAIDKTHYPIFHQMEGVKIVDNEIEVVDDLKKTLSGLIEYLFPNCQYRFNSDYFPFTDPSFEVEVFFEGKWLEVLGCGKIHKEILSNCGLSDKQGWAFGLGLERLAMIFFDINDIRYFWSEDERFLSQFSDGEITKFKEYSKFPSSARDFSFWIDLKEFDENGFFEIIRDNGRDLIENVSLIDEFKKEEKISRMYRITFQSNDRSLTNEEINIINDIIRNKTISAFNVIPR
jgi:phenylalanyl-tRNA synthetase alpha chain